MRRSRTLVALSASMLAVIAGIGTWSAPAQAVTYHPGAASLNDPLAPGLGNGGYDVSHYDIRLTWDPASGRLRGTATIIATLTQNLSSFNLDFALPATSVTVDGTKAAFASVDGPEYSYDRELVVTPAHGLDHGDGMTVVVTYDALPGSTLVDGSSNWATTPTGVMCWNEPDPAAEWWFPGNDHPSDKATYDVWVTAPKALTAVTNGRLVARSVSGTSATSHWRTAQPMASYVTMLAIGKYDVQTTSWGSVPVYYAYEQGLGVLADRARANLSRTPEILTFLQNAYGPYPYDAAGGIVVGYGFPSALETQTRPIYESGLWQNTVDNTWAVVHENAHQWYGDSATMRRWNDIWLAEGFATYTEWLWSQAHDQGTTQQLFLATYNEHPASDDLWTSPLDQPFYPLQNSVYERGAMLLQALHNRVGDTAFRTIMRQWAEQHRTGNGSTKEFETLATSVSGQDLGAFFTAWVDQAKRPARTVANGFPATGSGAAATSGTAAPRSLAAIERTDAMLNG